MSEFRRDAVTGDWIIVAPERAKRPDDFLRRPDRTPSPKETCPFDNLQKTGNWPPVLTIPGPEDWRVLVISNKYPALTHQHVCAELFHRGPYQIMPGVGHHELAIPRDHNKMLAALDPDEALDLFRAFRDRYRVLGADDCVRYVVAFHNYGPSAGASVYHPHCQIFAVPIVPPSILHSIRGSDAYSREHGRCVHCDLIKFEEESGSRIVAENAYAVAIAPFASHSPFEVRIFPRRHEPYFERMPDEELRSVAMLLTVVLHRVREYLRDPDLNFFIHSAPTKNEEQYQHYHWHIEILPKISVPAGFELSTGVLINVIDPDKAARMLREGRMD